MKLVNPTDEELNAAFAEKVAGWTRLDYALWNVGSYRGVGARERCDGIWITNGVGFTKSADLVLPWLEKFGIMVERVCYEDWEVRISNGDDDDDSDNTAIGVASSFPCAAVIALLRAHGVELEFTK